MTHRIIDELHQLIPQFCRLSFDSSEALARWGHTSSGQSNRLEIQKPRALSADRLELERTDVEFAAGFPSTLNLSWNRAEKIGIAELEKNFGPHRVVYSTSPHGPAYYMFQIDDQPLTALLRFTAEANSRSGQLVFHRVSLRRIAPDPHTISPRAAVRFIVIADFHATEDLSDRAPLPTTLRSRADLKELLIRLQPSVVCNVANHLEPSQDKLHMHFSPSALEDFEIESMLASVPAGAALLRLRRRVAASLSANRDAAAIRPDIESSSLPEHWKQVAARLLRNDKPRFEELLQTIDRALSAQADALFSCPAVQELSAAWLGLAFLVSHFDFSQGSQIEVFSARTHQLPKVLRRGFADPERRHLQGLVPALVIADYADSEQANSALPDLAELTDRVRVPMFVQAASAPDAMTMRTNYEVAARFLAAVNQRLCVRSSLDDRAARYFQYRSGHPAIPTACWASGVWAAGALAAQSLAAKGHMALADVSVPRPALCLDDRPWVEDSAVKIHGSRPTTADSRVTRFGYDPAVDRVYAASVTALDDSPAPAESFEAKLVFAPVLHFVRRWIYQNAARVERRAAALLLEEAARQRFPNTEFAVEIHESLESQVRLRIKPQFPVRAKLLTFELAIPWPK